MILNNVPSIKVTSNDHEQNLYSVVPNFVFVNQPEVKALETKNKRSKRLIVWFDVRNEHDRNQEFGHISTILEDFNFQLTLRTDKGHYELKPDNVKEVTKLGKIMIVKDADGVVIDNNVFAYEISEDKLSEEMDFKYSLTYKNDQQYGLTNDGTKGSNQGVIIIRNNNEVNNEEIILNNAFAYLGNKSFVINRDVLKISKSKIGAFSSTDNPLFNVSVRNEIDFVPELSKSKQIRAELSKITNTGVNYLQTSESTLKTVQKGNLYKIHLKGGNHYDFQTNKWIKDGTDKTFYFDKTDLKLAFEYNYQKFNINLKINDNNLMIKRTSYSANNLRLISSYKNVKPNTKFNTFISSRNDK